MKKKPDKPRNWLVQSMRLHTKPGSFKDKKKEKSRRACRELRQSAKAGRY
jgi:hypothetical protein